MQKLSDQSRETKRIYGQIGLEKEEKVKSRKVGLLIGWMICFMLGWMLSCLGNDYEDILFMNYVRNFVPLRESYCPSEPRWIYKQ